MSPPLCLVHFLPMRPKRWGSSAGRPLLNQFGCSKTPRREGTFPDTSLRWPVRRERRSSDAHPAFPRWSGGWRASRSLQTSVPFYDRPSAAPPICPVPIVRMCIWPFTRDGAA
uniref:Uncharacterized protein npsT n=1 Tax=Streptomyces sp. DSM 5940 TaxID=991132 RepID=F1CHU0_9ACTN|nr:hypothetical protein [Streptomyces sp. DSM 5940]